MEERRSYIMKAILLWCMLFVISILLGYSIYNTFSGRIHANAYESMYNNLQFAESSYEIFMNQMKMGMLQASVDPGIKELIAEEDGAALGELLKKWGIHRYYVDEWYIVGRNGGIIASAGETKNLFALPGGSAKIKTIIEQAYISKTVVMGTELIYVDTDRKENTLMQYVVVPVVQDGGQVLGCIVTAMNLNRDNNITGKIMDDAGMYSIIAVPNRIITSNLEHESYGFTVGSELHEDIKKEVLEKGLPYIKRLGGFSARMSDDNTYFGAFRPIKDINGNIIGAQGIVHNDRMVNSTLGQIRDFTITVVILLISVFSAIAWSYFRTQGALLKEKQFSNRLSMMKKFSDMVRQASSEDQVYEILFDILKGKDSITQIVVMRKDYNDKNLVVYKALDNEKFKPIRDMSVYEDKCWAIKAGKEFIYNNTGSDFACRDFYSKAESYLCLPIILGGIVSGVIQIQSDRKGYFTYDVISEIKIYIDTITPVISNLRLLENLNSLASIDTLTKVYNRRYLDMYIEEQIRISKENNLHFSVIMLDIDFFKRFNDTYGHDAGDYVLMHFADTLKFNVREGDVVSRYGGEEFVVVLPRTDMRGAYRVAEKLRKKVEEMSLAAINSEDPPSITCSLGISCYPLHGNNMDRLIQSADKALYEAKNSGRNRTCIYGEEKQQEIVKE